MKIYIYGIIDFNDNLNNSIKGLGDRYVYNIPYQDIGVVVSNLPEQVLGKIDSDYVIEHEKVLESLMEGFSVLPMRFLTVFDTKENLISMVRYYYNDFKNNLDRLYGKVELGVKVIWPGESIRKNIINLYAGNSQKIRISGNSQAMDYVTDKFQEYKTDKAFEEEANSRIKDIDRFFNNFVVEKRLEKLKSQNLLLNASYLVEKEKQEDFKEAFEHLRNVPGNFKYLLSGPWPPYNFVLLSKKSHTFNNLDKTDIFDRILNTKT